MDIEKWVEKIQENFNLMCDRELIVHYKSRELSAMCFLIKALANPDCKDADKVLSSIMNRRTHLLPKETKKMKDARVQVEKFIQENGKPPTIRELSKKLGVGISSTHLRTRHIRYMMNSKDQTPNV